MSDGSLFDDSSEQEGSFFEPSSASLKSFSHSSSHQPGGQDSSTRTNQFSVNPTVYTPQCSSQTSSVASTKSSGGGHKSYTTCDEWVWGVSPRFPVSREPGPPLSSASSLNDPILQYIALHTPSASPTNSAIRQTAGLNTPSSSSIKATESDKTDSDEEEPSLQEGEGELSSVTSEGSWEADIILFPIDLDHGHQVAVIPPREALFGLQLPKEFRNAPSFCDANNDGNIDGVGRFLENGPTNLQTTVDAIPWMVGREGLWWPNPEEGPLAPPLGLAYNEYYMRTRKYTKGHKKAQRKKDATLESCKAEPTFDEPITGTAVCRQDTTPYVLGESSWAWIESRGKRSKDRYNKDEKHFPETVQQPNLYHPVQYVKYSLETLAYTFHPSFLVSHLSRTSLSNFTDDLYAPNDLIYGIEHCINFSFPIGPPISLNVCAFTPRDNKAIRSYQKQQDKDKLDVQDSLPITVNLFSVELQAEELDTWLDQIVGSKSRLSEYVDLMLRRQEGQQAPQILKSLVSWYRTSKELSKPARHILRTALKLLITTTLLSLVPKATNLPESLWNYLSHSSQYPHAVKNISKDAPKLLTRQIKASIYHLQRDLLCHLFHHFGCATELAAEVKVAVAIIVAFVLDLVRDAGRQFAKYSREINSTVDVKEQEVKQYETNMQTQVFDRVRASILDPAPRTGALREKLRDLGSTMKGKGNETFLSVIVNTVYEE